MLSCDCVCLLSDYVFYSYCDILSPIHNSLHLFAFTKGIMFCSSMCKRVKVKVKGLRLGAQLSDLGR